MRIRNEPHESKKEMNRVIKLLKHIVCLLIHISYYGVLVLGITFLAIIIVELLK